MSLVTPINPTGNPHAVYRYNSGGQAAGLAYGHDYKGGGAKTPSLRAKCLCGAELFGLEQIEAHEELARSWNK